MKPAVAVKLRPGERRWTMPPSRRAVRSAPVLPRVVPWVSVCSRPPSSSARARSFWSKAVVVYRTRARAGSNLSEPNCEPAPLSTRTETSAGFQATRKPTGMGEGTLMGISRGGSCWAAAGAARAQQRAKARERTEGTISAVRPRVADRLEDRARDEVRGIAARLEQRTHLGGGDLRDDDALAASAPRRVAAAPDGDDARELRHPVEALPLGLLRVEVAAEHEREARAGVLALEPFEQVHGAGLPRLLFRARDAGRGELRGHLLAEGEPVLVRPDQRLSEGVLEDGNEPQLVDR